MFFKKIFTGILLASIFTISVSGSVFAAPSFGIVPEDNDVNQVLGLENEHSVKNDVIGFIFDAFNQSEASVLQNAVDKTGGNRVYHVSVSPFGFSSKQVAEGAYDESYLRFFRLVKKNYDATGAKFMFRTMHEMNGSWYSWSGDPVSYRLAWRHVYDLSRQVWLSKESILFIFSANSQDLPSVKNIVGWELIFCSPALKKKTGCYSWENYYPGDDYVDVMGETLYNWWRGRGEDWAKWRTFKDLLYDGSTNMFNRLSMKNKGVFLDEFGTTAVDFKWSWSNDKAVKSFNSDIDRKNTWISDARFVMENEPRILGGLYFNRDKTNWLTDRSQIWELDWSAYNTATNKFYSSILGFYNNSSWSYSNLPFARDTIKEIAYTKSVSLINQVKLLSKWDVSKKSTYLMQLKNKANNLANVQKTANMKRLFLLIVQHLDVAMKQ